MEYQNMYFISNSQGVVTSYDVVNIPQNSNNIKLNFCGNFTATTTVKLAITQANGATLPTRAVPKSLSTYTVGGVTYDVYSYRMVQDDTKICPSTTGTLTISFTVEDDGDEIVTTQDIALTIVKTTSASVTNTPADTIDAIMVQQNQNTTKILELMADITQIDTDISGMVDKTTTISGIDLQDDITASELKTALSLNNVENTSDLNKPVSTLQQAAINQSKTDIIGGASADYNTLKKIEDKVGANNGIATLDENGTLTNSQIPAITLNKKNVVASEAEMLALDAVVGDWALRTDINESYILIDTPASELSNWQKLLYTDSVTSVNTKSGNVVLDDNDLANTSSVSGAKIKDALDTLDANKLNKADKYTAPIELDYNSTNNYWVWDYSEGDNAVIEIDSEPTTDINIINATEGDIGVVTVIGGQLTLPANSILSADFGYLTAVGNQYYRYSFYYNGTDFEWHRTVLGVE